MIEVEVERREGAGKNSNLEAKKKWGTSVRRQIDQVVLHRTSTSRALAGIQIYKKERVEGGRYGTRYRYLFPCPGIIVVSVDKAASSSHMDAENAIKLGKK